METGTTEMKTPAQQRLQAKEDRMLLQWEELRAAGGMATAILRHLRKHYGYQSEMGVRKALQRARSRRAAQEG